MTIIALIDKMLSISIAIRYSIGIVYTSGDVAAISYIRAGQHEV
jgi:hypothetical protein